MTTFFILFQLVTNAVLQCVPSTLLVYKEPVNVFQDIRCKEIVAYVSKYV